MHKIVCYHTCTVAAIFSAFSLPTTAEENNTYAKACHYLPGDPGWPTDKDWSQLNSTVGGRLILGTPLAQSCYPPNLNADACATIQDQWVLTET